MNHTLPSSLNFYLGIICTGTSDFCILIFYNVKDLTINDIFYFTFYGVLYFRLMFKICQNFQCFKSTDVTVLINVISVSFNVFHIKRLALLIDHFEVLTLSVGTQEPVHMVSSDFLLSFMLLHLTHTELGHFCCSGGFS